PAGTACAAATAARRRDLPRDAGRDGPAGWPGQQQFKRRRAGGFVRTGTRQDEEPVRDAQTRTAAAGPAEGTRTAAAPAAGRAQSERRGRRRTPAAGID